MPLAEADWLLCLDLDVRLARIRDELLAARARGLRVCVNLYDLMPVLHPEWFPRESGPDGFAPWLRVMLGTADLVLVNSLATADQLRDWVRVNPPDRVDSFDLALLRLGSGFASDVPANSRELRSHDHFVMVGTVEPRKGHAEVLAAFEKLWADGSQARLTVVGRSGWMVEGLAHRMEALDAQDDRFRWAQRASDEELQTLYAQCTAVVMASEGEGFGLPIIEAAVHGCPVVVRDLPVFREIAGDSAMYFRADGSNLADVLEKTQRVAESGQLPLPSTEHVIPWRGVATRLTALLRGTEPVLDRWSSAERGWSGP
jgi:glycosyltransferase involved in cell wall biosynthesis